MSQQGQERKLRVPTPVIVGIILAALCGVSWYIRAVLPHDKIFVDGVVWFRETDAYYHMRYIEALVRHFPHTTAFDPYILYPGGGAGTARQPFFDLLTSAIILLLSRGVPSLHTMQTIAAYMPPILGTLTLIPVYFIGKELFSRWAGVVSAALVAILPGEFLHRSLLGFTDHHVAETLFSTTAMLFLIMAIKRAREREISFSHVLNRDWPTIARPLVYAALAGIFLGLYLLSWWGGLLFIFIIFLYLVIQFIVDHLRRRSTDYLCIVGTPLFLIAFLMLLPILAHVGTVERVSLLFAILAPIGLSVISRLMARRALQPVYYPLVLVGLAGIGLAAFRAASPSLLQSMFSLFGIFRLRGGWLTIMEATPLLSPQGTFTFDMAWANFTTSFFIAIIALVMLVFVVVKERSAEKSLFLVWTVIMLVAILAQRRFGYYYAVNAAVLTGYFSWKMLDLAGLKRLVKSKEVVTTVKAVKPVKKFKKKEKRARDRAKPSTFMQPRGVWVSVILIGIVLFFLVLFPNVSRASALAQQPPMMNKAWYDACAWLKDNTPEPFGDPDFYYALYPPYAEFEYPDTAYGVMSWWDYGYYIMQIGHRIPNANPGQAQAAEAGKFFTAQNETAAQEIVQQYNLGTKYVMIDSDMVTGKFYAMVQWAGKNLSDFYEAYYVPTEQGGQWAYLFYPAFYQSMAVRLYNFDCEAWTPSANATIVISYEERQSGGQKYKVVTSGQAFPTYEDALAYIASQPSGNYRIVGTSTSVSPVPLEALTTYKRVYPDPKGATAAQPTVKIFQYIGPDEP